MCTYLQNIFNLLFILPNQTNQPSSAILPTQLLVTYTTHSLSLCSTVFPDQSYFCSFTEKHYQKSSSYTLRVLTSDQ
jgi:hypothetical protein